MRINHNTEVLAWRVITYESLITKGMASNIWDLEYSTYVIVNRVAFNTWASFMPKGARRVHGKNAGNVVLPLVIIDFVQKVR